MSLLDKRIPTILGLLILLGGIGAGIYFVGKNTLFAPQASPEITPKKVKITNIKNDQLTVSWLTTEDTVGLVRYGNTPSLTTTVPDDREQRSGTQVEAKTHYVTLTNLQPATKYFFKIGSGSENNLFDNQGSPYEVTTAPSLGAAPPADLANGKILLPSGQPAAGAIVYLTLPQATPLSALVANDGSWVINLATALTPDLTGYAQYDLQTVTVDILAQGDTQVAKAQATTANDNPVPEMTLGQNYDFQGEATAQETPPQSPAPQTEEPEIAAQVPSQFPTEPLATPSATPTNAVTLTNPAATGETIHSLRPEIMGTGPAKTVLTITVESPKVHTSTVVVGDDGTWSYTPSENLEPGDHTITIDYVDAQGKDQTLKRTFTVVAATGSASLPAFTATPSASATPSPSPRTTMPSTSSGVPTSGVAAPTLGLFFAGLLVTLLGFTLKLRQTH
jgi:hypothetical protein